MPGVFEGLLTGASFLQILRNRRELFQRSFQIRRDVGGDVAAAGNLSLRMVAPKTTRESFVKLSQMPVEVRKSPARAA